MTFHYVCPELNAGNIGLHSRGLRTSHRRKILNVRRLDKSQISLSVTTTVRLGVWCELGVNAQYPRCFAPREDVFRTAPQK